mmetsp:Transcript_7573/g.8698  ORF Transcript_7573/g.8698 Transcript_7573/m.8698 type:complete len:401 (+) Transcript_7573:180-1382(+)
MFLYNLRALLFEMTWVQVELPNGEKGKSWIWFPTSKYSDIQYLSSGGFGEIFTATTSRIEGGKQLVAMKRIPCRKQRRTERLYTMLRNLGRKGKDEVLPTLKEVETEIELLKKVQDNPFIIGLLDSFRQKGYVWIVTEYAKYRDLRGIVQCSNLLEINDFDKGERLFRPVQKSLPIHIILHLMAPIFDAVRHLHSHGIVHRDIKEDNVLLTEAGIPKLGDFGGARTFETLPIKFDSDYTGTEYYVPPEAIRQESYTTAVDAWGLGVTMLSLYYCGWPFTHKWQYVYNFLGKGYDAQPNGQNAMLKLVRTGPYRKKKSPSEEWIEFDEIILSLMVYKQENRSTVSEMCSSNQTLKSRLNAWNKALNKKNSVAESSPENENSMSSNDFTMKLLEEAYDKIIQ